MFLPFVCAYLFFNYRLNGLRAEFRTKVLPDIGAHVIRTLRFSKAEAEETLHWENKGEFEFAGEMYDLVKLCETADSLIILCWNDKKETSLKILMNNFICKGLSDGSNREKDWPLLTILKILNCSLSDPSEFLPDPGKTIRFFSAAFSLPDILISVPEIPPSR